MHSLNVFGRSKGVKRLAATAAIALAAAVALPAFAQHGHGRHGHEGGGFGGPGLFMGSPEHVDRAVEHFLHGVNATDAQRAQIKQIATAAATDLKAQHQGNAQLRQQALQVWTAPTVDATAVETVRQQMLAQHDQASKRITQAMLEISRVLTPEQRAQIAQRMQKRGEKMRERAAKRAASGSQQ